MLLARCSRPLFALLVVPLFVACGYGDHISHDDGYSGPSQNPQPSVTVEQSTIDTDQLLKKDKGVSARTYIEYEAGGTYHVTTSCDVGPAGPCYWDIVVTVLGDAALLGVTPFNLEGDDTVTLGGKQARLVANTSQDLDGFTIQTDPGAAIELDALLDNDAANLYLAWIGDGAIHSGAPSNPIDLVPSSD